MDPLQLEAHDEQYICHRLREASFNLEAQSEKSRNFAPLEHSNSGTITQDQPRRRLSAETHQSISPLYDGDTNMPVSTQLADSEFENLLLSMMAS